MLKLRKTISPAPALEDYDVVQRRRFAGPVDSSPSFFDSRRSAASNSAVTPFDEGYLQTQDPTNINVRECDRIRLR